MSKTTNLNDLTKQQIVDLAASEGIVLDKNLNKTNLMQAYSDAKNPTNSKPKGVIAFTASPRALKRLKNNKGK